MLPKARAGSNQTVSAGAKVTLDATASSDPKGGSLTYTWTQVAGSTVVLSDPSAAKPTFTAPAVSALTGLSFNLVVRNAMSASAPSSVTVTVTPAVAPGGGCDTTSVPCVRQFEEWAAGDDNPEKRSLTFKQPVLAGSTVLAYASDMNITGMPIGSGTPPAIALSDSQNGTYKELLSVNDQPDYYDIKLFSRSNVGAGSFTAQAVWQTNQWHAFMIVEVANVKANATVQSIGALSIGVAKTKDAVSSGVLNLGDSPALVVGLGINVGDALGDVGAPLSGTGFAPIATVWNWNGKEGTTSNQFAILQSAYSAHPGSLAVTVTPTASNSVSENVIVIAAGLQ